MKRSVVAVAAALLGTHLTASALELNTQEQLLSYTLGVQVAQNLKAQGIKVDVATFSAALEQVQAGESPVLSVEEMTQTLEIARNTMTSVQQVRAEAALATGREFQARNKAREAVTTLPSGLQYEVLQAGAGESPSADSKVTVHYVGTLVDGTVFDSSVARGEPVTFPVNGVIPGFREALRLMQPGAKWRVVIPSELGYGPQGAGENIGPNETLIFDIELLSIDRS